MPAFAGMTGNRLTFMNIGITSVSGVFNFRGGAIMRGLLIIVIVSAAISFGGVASAATCHTVRFADMSWTGNIVKTELAAWILDQLGYKTSVTRLSLAIANASMAEG